MPHQPEREVIMPDERIFGEDSMGSDSRVYSRFTPPTGSILGPELGAPIPVPPVPTEAELEKTGGFVESFNPPSPAEFASRAHAAAKEDTSVTSAYATPEDDLRLDDPLRLLSVNQKDYLLANLIAGRTVATIRRYYKARFSADVDPKLIRRFKNRNLAAILEGRAERYKGIKKEGLAMAEERIIQLATNAELLQAKILAQAHNQDPISLKLMREFRETLDDIAQEVGHRRKGLDVDAGLIVSVVQGPAKARTYDEWERSAQGQLQEGISDSEEITNDSPPAS